MGIQPALCARSFSKSWPWALDNSNHVLMAAESVLSRRWANSKSVDRSAQSDVSQENKAFCDEGLGREQHSLGD